MAAEWTKREVAAPAKDWLTQKDVLDLLDVSERTLADMIERGEFPRAVAFRGANKDRWRWVDVCWYMLAREVADRLAGAPPEEGPEGDEPQPPATGRNRAQPPAK